MYKIINNMAPSYLNVFSERNTKYNLRSNEQQQLFIQQPRCESFKKCFRYSGATCWNNLPLEIRNSLSLREFKFRFKQMLFDDNDGYY